MTEVRKRMIESLQPRGLSERTQEVYVRAVQQLADHYRKSQNLMSEEELRQYFLHIKNVKKYSRASSTIALCGLKCFSKRLWVQFYDSEWEYEWILAEQLLDKIQVLHVVVVHLHARR